MSGLRTTGAMRRAPTLIAVAVALGLSTACTRPPPKPDAAQVRQFSGRAYAADEHYAALTTTSTWNSGGGSYDIALSVPDQAGRYPLVIYLPGLGETRDAGSRWRSAWTEAGYAVLSIQLIAEDAKTWSAPKARTGDFAALARERYSAKNTMSRVAALQGVWRELGRLQAAGTAPLERIDLARVAVAGFDLGAYTAMTLAGETRKDLPPVELSIPVSAVIALSPYADFSGATFSERYGNIKGPVLSITTDTDADAIGLVTSPSVRKAPFEYMPEGGKFLLLLYGVPHFVLGGDSINAEPVAALANPEKAEPVPGARTPGGPTPGNGPRLAPPVSANADSERAAATVASVTANALGAAAITGVTTAFLDAYLKRDTVAAEWLDKDAARWLRDKGEVKKK